MLARLKVWCVVVSCMAGAVCAQDVTVGFSQNVPPYVFSNEDRGIEVDVFREALALRGHRMVPRYYPKDRLPLAFQYGRIDATSKDIGRDLTQYGGHYAKSAVYYDNVLIALSDRGLAFNEPEDLADLLVIGFVGAQERYSDWLTHPLQDGLYFETEDQKAQTKGLYRGHFAVMLTDRHIFKHFTNRLVQEGQITERPVTEYPFSPVNPEDYRPVFRDPTIRDDFNAGLLELQRSGRLEEIYRDYTEGVQQGDQ